MRHTFLVIGLLYVIGLGIVVLQIIPDDFLQSIWSIACGAR